MITRESERYIILQLSAMVRLSTFPVLLCATVPIIDAEYEKEIDKILAIVLRVPSNDRKSNIAAFDFDGTLYKGDFSKDIREFLLNNDKYFFVERSNIVELKKAFAVGSLDIVGESGHDVDYSNCFPERMNTPFGNTESSFDKFLDNMVEAYASNSSRFKDLVNEYYNHLKLHCRDCHPCGTSIATRHNSAILAGYSFETRA